MKDDLSKFAPAFKCIMEDMTRWKISLSPDNISGLEQLAISLEPIRLQHLGLKNAIETSGLASTYVGGLVDASQHWQGMIVDIAEAGSAIKGMSQPHGSWLEGLNLSKKLSSDLTIQLKNISCLQLSNIALRATITESIFAGINLGVLQDMTKIVGPAINQLHEAINDMTGSYAELSVSLEDLSDLVSLPKYSMPGATREIFLAGYTLQTICPVEEEQDEAVFSKHIKEVRQETNNCSSLLYSIDPALVFLYKGAQDALNSENEDKDRHVMVSLRELWNHLLHRIAPDEKVNPWAASIDENLIFEGRPTRRARILYICRGLNHDPLSEFFSQDTKALIKMMEVFNRIHELRSNLTKAQLHALILRSDSWITYLLQIYDNGNQ